MEGWTVSRWVYGIALGGAFFAESMFTRVPVASKVALVSLVRQLQAWGFHLMDCQQSSPHVMALGAEDIPRHKFLDHLTAVLNMTERRGHWNFDLR